MNLPGNHIADLIPQREPFMMVDMLVESTGTKSVTRFEIKPENIFVADGVFREPGIIENIAQTAAAGLGFISKSKGLPVSIGFIAAISNLKIISLPAVGITIETSVERINQVFDFIFVQGSVLANNNLIAECEIKIYLKN